MSKVAAYLQGHITGEVITRRDVRELYSRDGSVLERMPEMVVYPRSTNDIRKALRFAWQLAEKGHTLPVTARGLGTNATGAAIGSGISLVLPRYMDRIFEFDSKQKLVRLQPGVSVRALQNALRLHGSAIPPLGDGNGSVGGEVATNSTTRLELKYGRVDQWVNKLEVVLDTGDVIQTGKISKRELGKRKGWQGREGDIYRGVDAILEEHSALISSIRKGEIMVQGGYPSIADVESKDGSVDLTPLFIGSQGTLGIITEMIMKTFFVPNETARAVALFTSAEKARDAVDELAKANPAYIEYFDGRYLAAATEQGNLYDWLGEKPASAAILTFGFDEFNEHARMRQLKKAVKLLSKLDSEAVIVTSEKTDVDTLETIRGIIDAVAMPALHADHIGPLLIDGFYLPLGRFEEFQGALKALETSLHIELPLYGSPLTGYYSIRPTLSLQKVGDKQKILKIIDQLNALVAQFDGKLVSGGEGKLLSRFARANWSEEYQTMTEKIRTLFDPHGILNPEVKSAGDLRDLVAHLRSDNSVGL